MALHGIACCQREDNTSVYIIYIYPYRCGCASIYTSSYPHSYKRRLFVRNFFSNENGVQVTATADRHTNQPIRMGGTFQKYLTVRSSRLPGFIMHVKAFKNLAAPRAPSDTFGTS
jgi:hypothetical protein